MPATLLPTKFNTLLADGLTNQKIAERLVVTVGTVKTHVHHVFGKLNVRSRTEAAARARALNLSSYE